MEIREKLQKYMHKVYRKSDYLLNFFSGVQKIFDNIQKIITRLEFLMHFNKLDIEGCIWWEKLLKISNIPKDIENRRAKIRAKFIACSHNNIELIQKICDSWKNGEIEADFREGKIKIEFVSSFGIPDDLNSLKESIEEIKPAHLPFEFLFKYLLIEDIDNVKTIEQMEEITLDMFAQGVEKYEF